MTDREPHQKYKFHLYYHEDLNKCNEECETRKCQMCTRRQKWGAWHIDGIWGGDPGLEFVEGQYRWFWHIRNEELEKMNKFPKDVYWVCRNCRYLWMFAQKNEDGTITFEERDKLKCQMMLLEII